MKYTNNSKVPLAMSLWLANDTYAGGNNLANKRISVTSLIKPLKQLILGHHAPESEADIMSFLSSRRGTAIHDAVEKTLKTGEYKAAAFRLGYSQEDIDRMVVNPTDEYLAQNPDAYPIYSEIRTEKSVLGWTVTGEFDLIINGQLEDIKQTKSYSWTKGVNDKKYIEQGSAYRWLNPDKVTKDVMAINFVFDDWSQVQASNNPAYPQAAVIQKKFDLIPYNTTQVQIIQRIKDIEALIQVPLKDVEDMLPPCTDEELWRSESEFKYYSKADAVRATKAGFSSYMEAMSYMQNEKGGVGVIKEIKGEIKACNWCKAFPVCKQKNQYIVTGELIPTREV